MFLTPIARTVGMFRADRAPPRFRVQKFARMHQRQALPRELFGHEAVLNDSLLRVGRRGNNAFGAGGNEKVSGKRTGLPESNRLGYSTNPAESYS
jgi:hypothetical protein